MNDFSPTSQICFTIEIWIHVSHTQRTEKTLFSKVSKIILKISILVVGGYWPAPSVGSGQRAVQRVCAERAVIWHSVVFYWRVGPQPSSVRRSLSTPENNNLYWFIIVMLYCYTVYCYCILCILCILYGLWGDWAHEYCISCTLSPCAR